MWELGNQEAALHAECGRAAVAAGVELLVGLGELSVHTCRGARDAGLECVVEAPDADAAGRTVASWARPGDVVLVKGSRGMRMESVVRALTEPS